MRIFGRVLAACFFIAGAGAAQSTPIDFTFDYQFTSGPLTGTLGSVFVTLEGYTGEGHEIFAPSDGSLLSFATSISGNNLSTSDSAGYTDFPQLKILDGLLTSVAATFSGTTDSGQYLFEFQSDSPNQQVYYQSTPNQPIDQPGDQAISYGSWDPETFQQLPPDNIPAPATLALFTLGLAGLGMQRMHKKPLYPTNAEGSSSLP